MTTALLIALIALAGDVIMLVSVVVLRVKDARERMRCAGYRYAEDFSPPPPPPHGASSHESERGYREPRELCVTCGHPLEHTNAKPDAVTPPPDPEDLLE